MRRLLLIAGLVASAAISAACAPGQPSPNAGRRVWRGPTANVSSEGLSPYERREIAQKISLPRCITASATTYRLDGVRPLPTSDAVPAGYIYTGYSLDRWLLLSANGGVESQPSLFVTVGGSTGIIADYPRLPADQACT